MKFIYSYIKWYREKIFKFFSFVCWCVSMYWMSTSLQLNSPHKEIDGFSNENNIYMLITNESSKNVVCFGVNWFIFTVGTNEKQANNSRFKQCYVEWGYFSWPIDLNTVRFNYDAYIFLIDLFHWISDVNSLAFFRQIFSGSKERFQQTKLVDNPIIRRLEKDQTWLQLKTATHRKEIGRHSLGKYLQFDFWSIVAE